MNPDEDAYWEEQAMKYQQPDDEEERYEEECDAEDRDYDDLVTKEMEDDD